jgi:hypothetical protein
MSLHEDALASAEDSISSLAATSAGVELISARLARAAALAFLGDMDRARDEMTLAVRTALPGQALEIAVEIGQLEGLLGEASRARGLFDELGEELDADFDLGEQALLARTLIAVQEGELERASAYALSFRTGQPRSAVAFEARRLLIRGLVGLLTGIGDDDSLRTGTRLAARQGARLWHRVGRLLMALADRRSEPSGEIRRSAEEDPVVLSMVAEAVFHRLDELDEPALRVVHHEAARRPGRWLPVTRRCLRTGSKASRLLSGELLEDIGERADIALLRTASREIRDPRATGLGHALARRLAPRIMVEDLGRVRIGVGTRVLDGSDIRRKVLALLCYLLTRPRFAATREEAVENLWPDQEPTAALNSLNQTVYFLRRVFEPDYREDLSPGYVMQDGEMVWLDSDLIGAQSRRCLDLIAAMGDLLPGLAPRGLPQGD